MSTKPNDALVEVRTRLPPDVLDRVDAWRAQQSDKPSRPEAVKRLLTTHFWPNLLWESK